MSSPIDRSLEIARTEGPLTLVDEAGSRVRNELRALRGSYTRSIDEVSVTFSAPSATAARRNLSRFRSERRALRNFLAEIEPDDVVYDVGANTGLYALFAAQRCPAGSVVAFEPYPPNVALLERDAARNDLENVDVREVVLSDSPGSVAFSQPDEDDVGFGSAAIEAGGSGSDAGGSGSAAGGSGSDAGGSGSTVGGTGSAAGGTGSAADGSGSDAGGSGSAAASAVEVSSPAASGSADGPETTIERPATTGDRLVDEGELPAPNVVKIDVEGAEPLVVDGLESALSDSACRAVHCEVHLPGSDDRPSVDEFGSTPGDLRDRLVGLGFTVEAFETTGDDELLFRAFR